MGGLPLHGGFVVLDLMRVVEFGFPVAELKVELEFEAWLEVALAWSLLACTTCQKSREFKLPWLIDLRTS